MVAVVKKMVAAVVKKWAVVLDEQEEVKNKILNIS
jgi:hypothetical protein